MNPLYCGVDVGGTKLSTGIIDTTGKLVCCRNTTEHTCLDEKCLLDLIADEVRQACAQAKTTITDLGGVGVGMAGHIRSRDGVVLTTSNLQGFKNYPVARELSERLGIRAVLDNDANCQALAEHRYGAGRGYENMVFITVSTGIGAGIIINNRLYRGHSGTAGEIGHSIVEPKSESVCTCGNRGCFMAQASTVNLEDLVKRKCSRHATSKMLNHLGGARPGETAASGRRRGTLAVDGRLVYEYACQEDPLALEIVDEYADYLAIMLYNTFQILNPAAIIMGGGLMNWGDAFFEKIKDKFHALAADMLHDPIAIVKAAIFKDCGVIGAAALLFDDAGSQ